MNQIISRINLFVKIWVLTIKKDNFAYVQTCPSGVQYSQEEDEDCCGEKDGCCGDCKCG